MNREEGNHFENPLFLCKIPLNIFMENCVMYENNL